MYLVHTTPQIIAFFKENTARSMRVACHFQRMTFVKVNITIPWALQADTPKNQIFYSEHRKKHTGILEFAEEWHLKK